MRKLFVDTWGWVTIHNKREPRHAEVKTFYQGFRAQGGLVYTTDYVLDETFTLFFRRLPFAQAKESLKLLDAAIQQGYLLLEQIDLKRFEEAKQLRLKLRDKPKISFTDLTSTVVMKERGLTQILTQDEHFIQVGMGFQTVP